MVCKSCGKDNKAESLVCESCGAKLTEQTTPDTQKTQENTPPAESQTTETTPSEQSPETKPEEAPAPSETQNTDPKSGDTTTAPAAAATTETAENKTENTTTTDTAGAPVVVNENKSSKYFVIGAVVLILLLSIFAAWYMMQASKPSQPDQPAPTKEPVPTALVPTREEVPTPTMILPSSNGSTKEPSAFNAQSATALTQMMTSGNPDTFKQAFASPENVPTDQDVIKAFQTIGNFEIDPITFKKENDGTATVDATLKVPGTDMKQAMEVTLTNVNGEWKIALMAPKR